MKTCYEHLSSEQSQNNPYYSAEVDYIALDMAKKKIKYVLDEALKKEIISKSEYNSMIAENKEPERFYFNFKIHKPHEKILPPRLLISGCKSIRENIVEILLNITLVKNQRNVTHFSKTPLISPESLTEWIMVLNYIPNFYFHNGCLTLVHKYNSYWKAQQSKLDQESWLCRLCWLCRLYMPVMLVMTVILGIKAIQLILSSIFVYHLGPFGNIECYLRPYWTFWDHFLPFRTIFTLKDHLGQSGIIFDHFGLCWIIVDSFGQFGTIWDRLGQCWAIAIAICLSHSNLEPLGIIWSHLEPVGASWLYLMGRKVHLR